MDLPSAGQMALQLMQAHGLTDDGWAFGFNRRKRTLGLCIYTDKRIELSADYVARNDVQSVRDTVLHEIAHALAGPEAGHGQAWKKACVRIGATPERTCSTAKMPEGAYSAICPGCQTEHERHRKPMKGRQYYCKACGPDKGGLSFSRKKPPVRVLAQVSQQRVKTD